MLLFNQKAVKAYISTTDPQFVPKRVSRIAVCQQLPPSFNRRAPAFWPQDVAPEFYGSCYKFWWMCEPMHITICCEDERMSAVKYANLSFVFTFFYINDKCRKDVE